MRVAEKDHKMLEPGGLYFPERFIIQGTQVDVGNFSAERSCDRLDFDPPVGCHGLAPLSSGILQEASQPVNGTSWLSAVYVDAFIRGHRPESRREMGARWSSREQSDSTEPDC